MTASLPPEIQQVFNRFVTTEFTTVDSSGQPITWPVTPYYRPGADCIDVTTGVGYPKKADDARANPKVSLLFSDPNGSGMEGAPMVLVQGTAHVDGEDFDANHERYVRESVEKFPHMRKMTPPGAIRRQLLWYYARLYIHVRPERVYVWPDCDATEEPRLLDSHMEEVRSGHDEEPESPPAAPSGRPAIWDERIEELGTTYPTAVVSLVAPDGFPFSLRVPVKTDARRRLVRLGEGALGVPVHPGRACLTAHQHDWPFTSQTNFQVRGDLVEEDDGWALKPTRVVAGFPVPKGALGRTREFVKRTRMYRRRAKQALSASGRAR